MSATEDRPLIEISGFLLVRRPAENYEPGHPIHPNVAPKRGDLFYGGVSRLAWFDLDPEWCLESSAVQLVRDFDQAVSRENPDALGVDVWSDLEEIQAINGLLRNPERRECIAVSSPRLAACKGSFYADQPLERLGLDAFQFGGFSTIFEGIFLSPGFDADPWLPTLNENGLFEDRKIASEYAAVFAEWSTECADEPVDLENLETIEVYRAVR